MLANKIQKHTYMGYTWEVRDERKFLVAVIKS